MANYRETRFCENLNIARFKTEGEYNIPVLEPYEYEPTEFVGFNCARTAKNKNNKSVHFFIDDYQFERVWRCPEQYINLLSEYHSLMTPDFSLYMDYPKAVQIYNHYRKQWLGAFWQTCGLKVIPTVSWSDRGSFEWCFDGTPKNSTVAVSSIGTQKDRAAKQAFFAGWTEMLRRLEPKTIVFYGDVPKECKGNIVKIKSFQDKFREVKVDGWTG